MRLSRLVTAVALGAAALMLAGCAGKEEAAGEIPASASLAPRDAVGFVTLVSDEGSEQWQNADRMLELFPGARESLLTEIQSELSAEGLTWEDDVAPALGPEVVIVVTNDHQPVVLTQPDDVAALDALMQQSDEPLAKEEVSGWTAIAQTAEALSAYRRALTQGTLEDVELFRDSFSTLPSESIARGWVDLRAVTQALTEATGATEELEEFGIQDLAAAMSAEDDGVLVSLGIRSSDGLGTTTYEPVLLDKVPADAVALLSFGGTQGALDRVERSVDLEGISGAIDDLFGVSLDSVLDALSGEGVLYVRESDGDVPEITLVLDPPNANKTWSTIEEIARKVADEAGGRIETGSEGGRQVNRLVLEDLTVVYARADSETLFITTSGDAIDDFLGDGPKLTDDDEFQNAAERVDLGERTNGFAYVDLDGLIPFIESVAGPDTVPTEAREVLSEIDSVILQTSADGDLARVSGFVRIPG
jgi:hypothetical protein